MNALSDVREVMETDEALERVSNEAHANMVDKNLPEAPASCSLTGYYKGYKVMVTQRDTNKLVKPYLENAMHAIDWMAENGFKPSWAEDTNAKIAPVAPVQQPANGQAPICGVHGNPMIWKTGVSKTTGRAYAFWSCPTKNADGSFCSYKAPKA